MRHRINLSLLAFAVVIISIAVSIAALPLLSGRQADHTIEKLQIVDAKVQAFNTVLSLLKDAETGQRGYIITGDETFLEPYNKGTRGMKEALEQLKILVADANERALVDRITSTAQSKLNEMARVIALYKGGQEQEAAAAIASRRGKHLMDEARDSIGKQLSLLAQQRVQVKNDLTESLRLNMLLGFAGTAAGVVVMCIAVFAARQHLVARAKVAQDAQRLAATQAEYSHQVEIRNQRLTISAQMLHAMDSVVGTEELAQVLPVFMRKLMPESSGCVYLYTNSRDSLTALADWGELDRHAKMIQTAQCWGLRLGMMHQVDNHGDLLCTHGHTQADGNFVQTCIPLLSQSEVLGVLVVVVPAETAPSIDAAMIRAVSEQLGLAISNVSLREKLRLQSTVDGLTGLYNRRYFDEALERELSRCERNGTRCAIVMLDLDYFKRINDTYGHDVGDLVLKETAKVIQKRKRDSDVACRYGGEELVLLLPDCDAILASSCAEDMRIAISNMRLKHKELILSEVTASFGVAGWPEDGTAGADLLQAADSALYAAKHAGRNQVHLAGKS